MGQQRWFRRLAIASYTGSQCIGNGDRVRLETRRDELELVAWIGGRGHAAKGSLFVPFFDEKRLINLLTLDEFDPFSKQPDFKKCAVKVVKA